MSNYINTTFEDSGKSGRITLYANPFGNGAEYYGRFERNTVSSHTLIARIQKHKAGTNELAVQQIAGFIKEEIFRTAEFSVFKQYLTDPVSNISISK